MKNLLEIVRAFFPGREVVSVFPLGSGKINETWLIEFAAGEPVKTVLQKLNTRVFNEPEHIMANLRFLAGHLNKALAVEPLSENWSVVSPYLTSEDLDHYKDGNGGFWRMLSYIEGAISIECLAGREEAHEVGFALGRFHRLTSDLDPDCFFDTLPGFHVTPDYLEKYDAAFDKGSSGIQSVEEQRCAAYVEKYRNEATLLEAACQQGLVRKRVVHGDPRVSNILFDRQTGKAVSIIDLDTVKPGLLHYDLGDCFRSACNPAGGNGEALDDVRFDVEVFTAVLEGYMEQMGRHLSGVDYDLIGPASCLISFELGLRYFTDHLEGDIYFRTEKKGQNLKRALSQFLLAEDIRNKEQEIVDVVKSIRSLL